MATAQQSVRDKLCQIKSSVDKRQTPTAKMAFEENSMGVILFHMLLMV